MPGPRAGGKEHGISRAVVINGSPRMAKGSTAMVLAPFVEGMADAGCEVELVYASRLKVRPCACGDMYCWETAPGVCCIKDDMQLLYPKLKAADTLVLATPVYVPLPGAMQNVINRLVPLMDPDLVFREGRTRARMREDVGIRKIALVATGGWWEMGNFGTLVRIAEELAADTSVDFAGAVLRPHVSMMKRAGKLTEDGEAILGAVRRAGRELVEANAISEDTLETISRPLISQEEFWRGYGEA